MAKGVSGTAVAAVFVGGILAWSGVKGFSVSTTLKDFIAGKNPSTQTATESVTPGGLISSLIPGGLLGKLLGGSSGGSTVSSTGGNVTGSAAQAKNLGQQMAAAVGWTGAEWTALNNIVMAESGWNVHAQNPSSGAYGIPQSLPANKLATSGSNWQNSAAVQIAWMLKYIKQTYGDPIAAWNFHLANGWY
jgi:resuscitation-promoting factor RpfB